MRDMPQMPHLKPKLKPKPPCWLCGVMLLGAISILAVASLAYWGVKPTLCVRNAAKELVLFSSLPAGQDFCIRFIHSVAKSPVEEWFYGRDGAIVLDRTVYQDFGAGLPHEASAGQRMEFVDGVVQITGYDVTLADLTVRVGRVAEHSLLLQQGARPWTDFFWVDAALQPATPRTDFFATPRTAGKVFIVVPLRDLAPVGAALTFSVESCFGKYCAPWF